VVEHKNKLLFSDSKKTKFNFERILLKSSNKEHAQFQVIAAVNNKEYYFPGYDAVKSGRSLPTFQENILTPYSGSNNQQETSPIILRT
jgi:hypothetical protein